MASSERKSNKPVVFKVQRKEDASTPPIKRVLDKYIAAIRGISKTAQVALPHIVKWRAESLQDASLRISKFFPDDSSDAPRRINIKSAANFAEFEEGVREIEEYSSFDPAAVLAKSLFTHLFAEFDAFVGELLKAIYLKNEKLLKGVSREISLSDILDYEKLEDVKLAMLEKEIETFRRDSYIEQFGVLEKKFGLTLRKFPEWSAFVELSQRRNILIHNGGRVSDQYLIVCEKEGVSQPEKLQVGEALNVSYQYFSNASRILGKIGIMLAYTLWGKIFPDESDKLHDALNKTIYESLQKQRWKFVAELSEFVLGGNILKNISEVDMRIRIVNAAIGLKFDGNSAAAIKLLESYDWSASYRDFKLALAVLTERWEEAVAIMKSIGRNGELLTQEAYHTWPLFFEFRKREEFFEAYASIYGHPYSEKVQTPNGPYEATGPEKNSGPSQASDIIDVDPKSEDPPDEELDPKPAS